MQVGHQLRRREDEIKRGAAILGWIFLAILLAFAYVGSAKAGSNSLGMELTLYPWPDGVLMHWWSECHSKDSAIDGKDGTHGIQCMDVPGTVIALVGTSTVKTNNEVLAAVWCGGQRVWIGEHKQGTVAINVSGLADANITGPCHIGVQSVGPYSQSGYEIQLTVFYR